MKKSGKLISITFMILLLFLAACGSKEEAKVDNNVNIQEETTKTMPTAEKEDSEETAVPETEEVLQQEASKGEDIDYVELHGNTLDRIYGWIMEGSDSSDAEEGEQVIIDAVKSFGNYAHYDLGYAVEEINEDGIPELIIGQTTQEGMGNMIYAIYTWKDGKFQCNAKEAEYSNITPGAVNDAKVLYLTPFSEYEPGMKLETEMESVSMEEPAVCAQWIEDAYLEPNGYDVFTADDRAEQRQVVFVAISKVSDFKVLSLNFEDVDETGNVKYAVKELYSQTELMPERPLMVGMSCDSTIPCYGISYVDENGNTRSFAVEVSGMDGAVFLNEF